MNQNNVGNLPFRIFILLHRLVKGSGLGKLKVFRTIRNTIYEWLRPRQHMLIEAQGLKMYTDSRPSELVAELLRDGIFEEAETKILHTVLGEGGIFVDVGANIGYYTLLAARIVGKRGRVIAFEPEPLNFELLKRNVTLNEFSNVTLVQQALSDKPGMLQLYINSKNAGGHHAYNMNNETDSVTVEATTLDSYLAAQSIERVDVIKIDIEGYEPFAFTGMRSIIKKNPHLKLFSEFVPYTIQIAGASSTYYLDDLRSLGFRINIIHAPGQMYTDVSNQYLHEYCRRVCPANIFCDHLPVT